MNKHDNYDTGLRTIRFCGIEFEQYFDDHYDNYGWSNRAVRIGRAEFPPVVIPAALALIMVVLTMAVVAVMG